MDRIEIVAPEGKVLKLENESGIVYGRKVNCIAEQAEQWQIVDEQEYLDWMKAQEEEIQTA